MRRGAVGKTPPRVLIVAGVDPGGGAGLAADVRTAAALGCHGLAAVTAITVQDSTRLLEVAPVPSRLVAAQIEAALGDAGADAVKVGMLGGAAAARAVAGALARRPGIPVVLDPVLRASVGGDLVDAPGQAVLLRRLLPLAAVVTPNLAEAGALLGRRVRGAEGMERAAADLRRAGARAVLLTGGHLGGEPVDLFDDGGTPLRLRGRRVRTRHTHGSGCALATAVACFLARGASPRDAARLAKRFVAAAIRGAYPLGRGAGPVNPLAAAAAGAC